MRFEIVNCVDPSFRSSSSKQKAKGVNLVSVFLRHNFLLPSNFLTLPFLIVTLQSLIKFWLFGHWPRKFARWLIGSTKKVISIYTFWVIVLLLRWFMNHKTTVQFLIRWFNLWESGSEYKSVSLIYQRSKSNKSVWTLTLEICQVTDWLDKKSNINLYIFSNCTASSLIYES